MRTTERRQRSGEIAIRALIAEREREEPVGISERVAQFCIVTAAFEATCTLPVPVRPIVTSDVDERPRVSETIDSLDPISIDCAGEGVSGDSR